MASLLSALLQAMMKNSAKKTFGDKETFETLLKTLREEHSQPFAMNYDKFTVDYESREIEGMPYVVLSPKDKPIRTRAVFLHGGAYAMEITPQHWQLLDKIVSASGAELWVAVYPLLPNYTVDDAFPKVAALYQRLCRDYPDCRHVLMGDSAGGGLAVAVAQYIKAQSMPMPDELILVSPWLDLTMTNPAITRINPKDATLDPYGLEICGRMWAGDRDLKDPWVSPLYGDLELDCGITVFTGTRDILNGDANAFCGKLKELGKSIRFVEEKGLPHDYVLWPISEAKKAQKLICEIL